MLSHRDAAYSAPIGTTLFTYSCRGMWSRFVVPATRTMNVAIEVQKHMCQSVSAMGYLNRVNARMYCVVVRGGG